MSSDNPLQKLIVDEVALDKEKLVSLIMGNLGISKSGEIVILPGFNSLSTKSKILSILLAKKAAKLMELAAEEKASIKDIIQKTGLPQGTIGRELSELKDLRLVLSENGYYVPDYAIHQITIESKSNGSATVKSKVKRAGRTKSQNSETKKTDKVDRLLQIKQEEIKPELIDFMLKPGLILERSLAVLRIARENGIDGLTPGEIEAFLKNKIRAGSIWKSNISLYLGKSTRYVDRIPDPAGKGFTYRIMAPGDKLLDEALSKASVQETKQNAQNDSPEIHEEA